MTTPFSVNLGAAARLDHAIAIASLPADLRRSGGQADVVVVGPGTNTASFAAAGRAVVIDASDLLDSRITALADGTGKPVYPALHLASCLAGQPVLPTLTQAGLVRSRMAWNGPLDVALLEHLAGLTALLGQLHGVRLLAQDGLAYSGSARTETGVDVLWSGEAEAAFPSYELDIVGLGQRLDITATFDGSARPLNVRHGDAQGLLKAHGIYETGMRRFWRSVVSDLRGEGTAIALRDIAPLVDLVRQLVAATAPSARGAA